MVKWHFKMSETYLEKILTKKLGLWAHLTYLQEVCNTESQQQVKHMELIQVLYYLQPELETSRRRSS